LIEEETVTRLEQSRHTTEWMQAVLASDQDLLAEVLRLGVEALMEAERDAYVGAAPFERTGERSAQRNGYKPRQLRTRVGALALRIPQTRDGGFYPSILQQYQRSEAALITSLAECFVQGVSTRKVSRICEELFGETLSHETVSRYWQELEKELEPWRRRALEETFPYVLLDARYEKARVDHRIVDVAVLVAIGISESGHRQVLGVDVAHGETTASWGAFLTDLKERGLRGVQLFTSDAHAGLAEARRTHFPGIPWQRCQRHFLMNALEKAPKALEEELHRGLRRIWDESEGYEAARAALRELAAELEPRAPELAEWLEVEGEETLSCFHFPAGHRRRIRTTNGNERVNQELLRRTKVVRIFPNPASCLRLASALLKEWHEDWITGRRYLRMEALLERARPERQAA
jgi:putative transposase